ncbi:hypothetical protein EVAR_62694_1 [Eumeta japonica]|uniref:CHK kinase-like domain-containing protein n=1 Tax=Eumeta variegata TaxID=151549 RepID=A0A4C1ZGK4_EUMVA|nr:hypothetical protein EVAR_62694_1 [Eumeta japonica]
MKRIQAKICAALEEMKLPIKLLPAKDVGGSIGVVLSAEICNDKGEDEPVVIKTTPIDVDLRKNIPITPMVKKEMLFYGKVLPEYEKIQAELKRKCVIAKCYAINDKYDNEFLVFEDLRSKGFIKWVPDTPVDFDHAVIAMRALGRYHGCSLVVQLRNPETFEDLKKLITDKNDVFLDSSFDYNADGARHYGIEAFKKFLKCVDDDNKKDKIIKMSNGVDEYLHTLRSLWSRGEKCVIIHGDYWTDNLLFKYQVNDFTVNETKKTHDSKFFILQDRKGNARY